MREASLPDLIPNSNTRNTQVDPHPVSDPDRPLNGTPENQRGQSTIMVVGQTIPLINRKHGGEGGEMLALQLGFEQVNGTPDSTRIDPFLKAIIEWGIGGANNTAIVDYQNGTCIRIPATTYRVSASYQSSGSANVNNTLRVNASVGYGHQSARVSNARFTERVDNLNAIAAGAATTPQTIPRFASSFVVQVTGGAGGGAATAADIDVFNSFGPTSQFRVADLKVPLVEWSIPIAQGLNQIVITNRSAFPCAYTIIYALTL